MCPLCTPSLRQQELSLVIGTMTAHSEAIERVPSDGLYLHSAAESQERPLKGQRAGLS